MFDDPKKELKRLEDQLLAAEMSDEDFERFYDEIYEEFGDKKPRQTREEDLGDLLDDVPQVRNYSNGYGTKPRAAQSGARTQNGAPRTQSGGTARPQNGTPRVQTGGTARPQNPRDAYVDSSRYVPAKKKENNRPLVILACLECLGIAGVVLYWFLFLI